MIEKKKQSKMALKIENAILCGKNLWLPIENIKAFFPSLNDEFVIIATTWDSCFKVNTNDFTESIQKSIVPESSIEQTKPDYANVNTFSMSNGEILIKSNRTLFNIQLHPSDFNMIMKSLKKFALQTKFESSCDQYRDFSIITKNYEKIRLFFELSIDKQSVEIQYHFDQNLARCFTYSISINDLKNL